MGVLEVRNTNGGILKNYTYQTFLALNPNAKKEILKSLYEQYRHKRIELFCCCNTNAINMSVSYRTEADTYYLKSFPKQAGSHDIDCHFYSESSISSLSNYAKNCIEDEKGNYHINLAAHDYKKLDSKSSLLSSGVGAKTDKIGKSSNKLTTNHLIKIIVTNAWNDYIHFEGANHYPTINSIFNQIITRTIKKFYISKVNLQQLLFKGGKQVKSIILRIDKKGINVIHLCYFY
ncbi:hypothetical protein B4147_0257 [Bacillus wiedmannii]|uniref:Uncharacterized protein n=1 Tax=Bacillus wiedmannii TaxID=1890302 RepID=A0A0G8BUZ0_9BACI|nr:DUF1173 family protein [Bacillus wiedmannii]KKZ90894.1 hypothetical protein B4147_0257 [Bacillus wiedmannii]